MYIVLLEYNNTAVSMITHIQVAIFIKCKTMYRHIRTQQGAQRARAPPLVLEISTFVTVFCIIVDALPFLY